MRTDKEIRQDVEPELDWEPRIDERRIGISVDTCARRRPHDRHHLAAGYPETRGSVARLLLP
jgi:hypothetical protein